MFLSVPSTVTKGSEITVQLSIPNLSSFFLVANDDYFFLKDRWKDIAVEWTDENSVQKTLTHIRYQGQTGLINFSFTVTSEYKSSLLRFRSLKIYDKSNGFLRITRDLISPNDAYDMEF